MDQSGPQHSPDIRTVRHQLSLRSIFSVIAVLAGIWFLIKIWQIILLIVIALILAGTLSPVITWLEQHNIKRRFGLGLVLLALIAGIAGMGALVIPSLVTQIGDLATSAPAIQGHIADSLKGFPLLTRTANRIRNAPIDELLAPLSDYALVIAGVAVQVIALGLTTVVMAFYLLADHERVKGYVFALLPRRFHLRTARILLEMVEVVGGYVRGQALTSLLIGLFIFAALWLAGTPNPLAIAVVAALADLIPIVGAILVIGPAVLATLGQGPISALLILIGIVTYLQIETHVLVPRIYGQTLRLTPLVVMLALLIGGQLLGIIGALLALPIAAGLRVIIEQLRIDLPGEQPNEPAQRALDEEAEAIYAEQTAGVPAIEAAAVAIVMAEQEQEAELVATGRVETPIEEQGDASPISPGPAAAHQT